MANETILATISKTVAKFGMTATQNGETFEIRKGAKVAATVIAAGPGAKSDYASGYVIDRKYDGRQALMGALGAQQIAAALKEAR
jgi:hypothetical protein